MAQYARRLHGKGGRERHTLVYSDRKSDGPDRGWKSLKREKTISKMTNETEEID